MVVITTLPHPQTPTRIRCVLRCGVREDSGLKSPLSGCASARRLPKGKGRDRGRGRSGTGCGHAATCSCACGLFSWRWCGWCIVHYSFTSVTLHCRNTALSFAGSKVNKSVALTGDKQRCSTMDPDEEEDEIEGGVLVQDLQRVRAQSHGLARHLLPLCFLRPKKARDCFRLCHTHAHTHHGLGSDKGGQKQSLALCLVYS